MKVVRASLFAFAALVGAASAVPTCPTYHVKVVSGTAHDSAGLKHTVQNYIHLLGGPDNGNNPGPLKEGHRSINWDAPIVPFKMPGDFFKNTVTRGAEFSTEGGQFRVSNPPNHFDDRFSSLNPNIASELQRFSPKRLFTSLKNNVIRSKFSVPGVGGGDATVSGFGAVFADVDRRRKTSIKYFDRSGCLIAKLRIARKSGGLSFGGIKVVSKNGKPVKAPIAKVKITLGNRVITDKFGDRLLRDIVVLDDLLYGEPQAILH